MLLSNAPLLHSGVNGSYDALSMAHDRSSGSSLEEPRIHSYSILESEQFTYAIPHTESLLNQYHKFSPHSSRMFDSSMQANDNARRKGRELFDRFKASDAYVKYRSRQEKEDSGSADQKWPEELDLAFCEGILTHMVEKLTGIANTHAALVHWPPMGRRKQTHKNKARGRNELIADYLEHRTGHVRTRKQVSSHIQVLKPFVEHDEVIMKYFSTKDPAAQQHYGSSSAYCLAPRSQSDFHGLPTGGHRAQIDYDDYWLAKNHLEIFQPADFQMFVYRRIDPSNFLHTYTTGRMAHSQLPDLTCPSWATLAHDYPKLDEIGQEGGLDCNVVLAEASIALPTQGWGDSTGVELAILLRCESRFLAPGAQVICFNRITQIGSDHDFTETETFSLVQEPGGTSSTALVKFCSRFWAQFLQSLVARAQWSGPGLSGDVEHKIANRLRGLSATQAFNIMTTDGEKRMLVIHWLFRLSDTQDGQTCWRRLRLPDQPNDYVNATGGADAWHNHMESPFEYESSSASAVTPAAWSATEGIKIERSLSQGGTADFSEQGEASFSMHNRGSSVDHQVSQMESYDPSLSFATPAYNSNMFSLAEGMSGYPNAWMGNNAATPFGASQSPRAVYPYPVQHGNRNA